LIGQHTTGGGEEKKKTTTRDKFWKAVPGGGGVERRKQPRPPQGNQIKGKEKVLSPPAKKPRGPPLGRGRSKGPRKEDKLRKNVVIQVGDGDN